METHDSGWAPPGDSASAEPSEQLVEIGGTGQEPPPDSDKRTLSQRIFSRRGLLKVGLASVAGFILIEPLRRRAQSVIDPIVGSVTGDALDAIDSEVLKIDDTIFGQGYGTVESAVAAKILAGDIDISNAFPGDEVLGPIGIIWSWTSLRLMLSTLREDVSLTGVRFSELSKKPLGDRRLIVFGGGGNGYAVHAYIAVTKEGKRLTRYTIDDGPTQDSIRLPLTSAVPHELEISFTPRDTSIYEWEVAVEFYRSGPDKYFENVFGPFTTSGLPDDGGRNIFVEGETVVEEDSLGEGSLLTTIFPELNEAD